jgi:hypothetical protein
MSAVSVRTDPGVWRRRERDAIEKWGHGRWVFSEIEQSRGSRNENRLGWAALGRFSVRLSLSRAPYRSLVTSGCRIWPRAPSACWAGQQNHRTSFEKIAVLRASDRLGDLGAPEWGIDRSE